ncbi:hypothetical protein [Mesorhizobium sp. ES1-3]|uniref:hypothetical protein n=1 Tax=Mesorhizobium sp. ES1-3 TaxID=2876628 RepID=UPI001CCFFC5C|nr:hypothetical protein [Mesorhizobium sp. ES1-3]MBZ9673442.1 hypothetical protein [Mesorhizobium sp. ES1-3]
MKAALPPVDPDFLIVEHDPEKLHAYAKGLWHHLRNIRSRGPANGYPKPTIKAAAVWLIGAYVDAKAAPSYEAYRLIDELLKPAPHAPPASTAPVRRDSEAAYKAAIAFEASRPPGATTLYAVAKHVRESGSFPRHVGKDAQKSAEATIGAWRKTVHYQDNVLLQRDPDALFRKWRVE